MRAADHSLIAECLKGNPAPFGTLVSRYQDRLYNTVYRLVDNPDDASDVVQEAFLNAYLSLRHFKGDSQFFTWLYRIGVNAAITYRRRKKSGMRPIDVGQCPGRRVFDGPR